MFPKYVPGRTCISLGRKHNYLKAGPNSVRCTECGSSRTVTGVASNQPSSPPVITTKTQKTKIDSKLDPQLVELVGRNWLTVQLLQAGLEVARPERDRGIDLIAYRDLDEKQQFLAYPIQMKAFLNEVFSIDPKYEKFPRLILAYVWNLADLTLTKCFALTFKEALQVADEMEYTKTASWLTGARSGKRGYFTSAPSKQLKDLLSPFEMSSPEKWSSKFNNVHD